MGQNLIREYVCDTCEQEVLGHQPPSGWVGLRHRDKYGLKSTDLCLHFGADSTGKTSTADVPKESWWCSPGCLKKWLLAQVEKHAKADLR